MELSVLQAVRIGYGVSILTMVVPCSTPVACAVEIAVLRTVGDAGTDTSITANGDDNNKLKTETNIAETEINNA